MEIGVVQNERFGNVGAGIGSVGGRGVVSSGRLLRHRTGEFKGRLAPAGSEWD